jgi:hypothetical protein
MSMVRAPKRMALVPNDRVLTPDGSVVALPSQLLHTMLLIIEHSRGKGEFAGYSYVSERNDNHAFGVLGLDATDDAAHIAEVRDFLRLSRWA